MQDLLKYVFNDRWWVRIGVFQGRVFAIANNGPSSLLVVFNSRLEDSLQRHFSFLKCLFSNRDALVFVLPFLAELELQTHVKEQANKTDQKRW